MAYTVAGLPAPPTSKSPPRILVPLVGADDFGSLEYWTQEAVVHRYRAIVFFRVEWKDGDRSWFEWSLEEPRATSRGRSAC